MSLHSFDFIPISIVVAFSLLVLSSCSSEEFAVVPPQERVQAIEQLQQAKQTDLEDAKDISLGPIAEGDYLAQADKAGFGNQRFEATFDSRFRPGLLPTSGLPLSPPGDLRTTRRAFLPLSLLGRG